MGIDLYSRFGRSSYVLTDGFFPILLDYIKNKKSKDINKRLKLLVSKKLDSKDLALFISSLSTHFIIASGIKEYDYTFDISTLNRALCNIYRGDYEEFINFFINELSKNKEFSDIIYT